MHCAPASHVHCTVDEEEHCLIEDFLFNILRNTKTKNTKTNTNTKNNQVARYLQLHLYIVHCMYIGG